MTRQFDARQMPTGAEFAPIMSATTFTKFQRRLELGPHADVHIAIGGTMNSASSPADPVFWLHHANLDRLWSQWQAAHSKAKPSNSTETLLPSPLLGVRVSSVLNLAALSYSYT